MIKEPYRPFQISCGLREGYELSNKVHKIETARDIIQKWIEERMKNDKKIAVGSLMEGQFIYPLIEDKKISSMHEPSFHYKGMIREDASYEEALEMLEDLAKTLAQELKQKRVHFHLCSEYFIIESD